MRSGEGPIATPRTQRPTNRGHRAGSWTSTWRWSSIRSSDSGGSVSGKRTGAPVTAETSRARPTMDRASPRFGLTSTSRTVSP